MRLALDNQLSPLLDAAYVEEAIRRNFEPLLEPAFHELLRRHYPSLIVLEVDGRQVTRGPDAPGDRASVSIRLGRRRLPSALGFVERHEGPLPDDRQGIAISTYGKVIKRGWDWLGLSPATPARISGLIEAPDLAACLTLSKNDFIRSGTRGATYLAYRKAIQEVVSRQLTRWGADRDADTPPRTVRLERDLERVLEDLSDEFPLLRSLVDRRAGGQRRLPMPGRGREHIPGSLFANFPADGNGRPDASGSELANPSGHGPPRGADTEASVPGVDAPPAEPAAPRALAPPPDATGPDSAEAAAAVGTLPPVRGRRRPARYGLLVQFESRPDDTELGRLVDSTIWINDAHAAYRRAAASRSVGYHIALSVALALAPLAAAAEKEHDFITRFLAQWGGAGTGRAPKARRSARRQP